MKKMVKVAALAAMVVSVALTSCNGKKGEADPSNTEDSAKSKSPVKVPKIPSYLYRLKYQGMVWIGAKDKDRLPADLVIPMGVMGILKDAFLGCTSLISVTLADTVQRVCTGAFSGCASLESVAIPEGVTEIGYDVFKDCTSLASVSIPSSVKTIHDTAFLSCPLKECTYAGTKEEWEAISKGSELSTENGDFVVRCTDDITEE